MYYVLIYYVVGVLVSVYFNYYYRLSEKTKTNPKKTDGMMALIGPWIFPAQIILHFKTRNNYKNQ